MEDFGAQISIDKIINDIIKAKLEHRNIHQVNLTNETKFSDIGFDSLDVMEFIIETEGYVKKRVDNRLIKNINTIGDLINLFKRQ